MTPIKTSKLVRKPQSGHNIRTCPDYQRDIEAINIRVEGDVRRAAEALRRMSELKDDEIRELKRELKEAERTNADLRKKLAAQATVEAQDSIIAAQFDEIEERQGVINRLLAQLGSLFS